MTMRMAGPKTRLPRAGEGIRPMGGPAELSRDQRAQAELAVDTRRGLGELYGEQEAARRAAASRAAPCFTRAAPTPASC